VVLNARSSWLRAGVVDELRIRVAQLQVKEQRLREAAEAKDEAAKRLSTVRVLLYVNLRHQCGSETY